MSNENSREIDVVSFKLPSDLGIKENGRKILELRFTHPDWSYQQIGDAVGVSRARVGQILNHPKVIAAMPHAGKQRYRSGIPKAVHTQLRLMDSKNDMVADKASARLLEDQRVIDGPELTIKQDITIKTVQELRNIVEQASALPSQIIDAEVVEGSSDNTGV